MRLCCALAATSHHCNNHSHCPLCRAAEAAQAFTRGKPDRDPKQRSQFSLQKVKNFRAKILAGAIASAAAQPDETFDQMHEATSNDGAPAMMAAAVQPSSSSSAESGQNSKQELASQAPSFSTLPAELQQASESTSTAGRPSDHGIGAHQDAGSSAAAVALPSANSAADAAEQQEQSVHCLQQEVDDTAGGLSVADVGSMSEPHASEAVSPGAASNRQAQLQQMRLVAELRPLCKQYGLPLAGIKQEVVSRIVEHERAMESGQQ